MTPLFVFINDQFVAEQDALVSFKDLSIQRGYGIFDFLRVSHNTPLFLEDHLARFYASAGHMWLPVPKPKEELRVIILELIQKNNLPESGVRITLTGGYSPDAYQITQPNLIVSQSLFNLPTATQLQNGIKLLTYPHQRQLPHVKTIDYLKAIWLLPELRENGADDVLYYNKDYVTECPRANIFMVTKDNRVITPAHHLLKGVIRSKVLELAKKQYTVEERNITVLELFEAKEVFITSTTKLILPVSQINEQHLNWKWEGSVMQQLANQLSAAIHHHLTTAAE